MLVEIQRTGRYALVESGRVAGHPGKETAPTLKFTQ